MTLTEFVNDRKAQEEAADRILNEPRLVKNDIVSDYMAAFLGPESRDLQIMTTRPRNRDYKPWGVFRHYAICTPAGKPTGVLVGTSCRTGKSEVALSFCSARFGFSMSPAQAAKKIDKALAR